MKIETLEREGGHIAMLVCLFIWMIIIMILVPDLRSDLKGWAEGVFGALMLSMRGSSQGKPPLPPNTTSTSVVETTSGPDAGKDLPKTAA